LGYTQFGCRVTDIFLIILFAVVLGVIGVGAAAVGPWRRARRAGAPIALPAVMGMRMRQAPLSAIVPAWIEARQAGLRQTVRDLEIHAMAGGDVRSVVTAMAAAKRAGVELEWDTACAINLAEGDVIEATSRAIERGSEKVTFEDAKPDQEPGL